MIVDGLVNREQIAVFFVVDYWRNGSTGEQIFKVFVEVLLKLLNRTRRRRLNRSRIQVENDVAAVLHYLVDVKISYVGIAGAYPVKFALNVVVILRLTSQLKVFVHATRINFFDDHHRYAVGNSYSFVHGGFAINAVAYERNCCRDKKRDEHQLNNHFRAQRRDEFVA